MGSKAAAKSALRVPKRKCCESTTKCASCPLRMMMEGTLPAPYTVKRRRLVYADTGVRVEKSELPSKKNLRKLKGKKAKRYAAAA